MEKLFWELYNADSEKEIDLVLAANKIFSDEKNWRPYGGTTGNFGTFESQQNHPVPALIEKITNSIDATLIKECRLNGVDPQSDLAPRTMSGAVEKFFHVKNGEVGELTNSQRRRLAEDIQIISTGDKQQPSITIFDKGEGQLPEDFERTFLSLHKNNKAGIPFVQGKYNMGSTGAVVFCGEKKYQLIASKRNPELTPSNEKMAFTLVRRHPLSASTDNSNLRATWYEYFSPNGLIPSFIAPKLDLGLYNRQFEYGSVIKLYSYQLPRGSRSDITLDLWRDLNQYMYHLPLPISVYEKRNYAVKTPSKTVLGNRTRILIDSRDKVEKIIEFSIPLNSGLGDIPIQVIIFKNEVPHGDFIKNKSIIFTQNGQIHGSEGQSFISQRLGFSLIKQHTLIHVDCTNIPTEIRQDLFMSNRTHLKQGPKTERLLDEITVLLKGSKELKKLNNDRKDSLLRDSKSDKELLESFLSKLPVDKDVINLLKKNGSLDFFKARGDQFNRNSNGKKNGKKLNRFPSVFNINLKKDEEGKLYKTIPLNSKGIVTIETDVEDDYLFRPVEKGEFHIEVLQKKRKLQPIGSDPIPNPNPIENTPTDALTVNRVGPSDGTIKLLIKPNGAARVGDLLEVRAKLTSPGKDFSCIFQVKVDEKISKAKSRDVRPNESFPNLPFPKKAFRNPSNEQDIPWNDDNLKWTGVDIVKVVQDTSEKGELLVEAIIINMDSYSLLNFLSKNRVHSEKEIKFIKDKYFLSVYLHSLFLFSIMQKMRKDSEELQQIELDEFISNMIKPYANFLLYENYHIEKFAFGE